MYRFLVLYSKYSDPVFLYAEGLIQFDGAVYAPSEMFFAR